MSVRISVKRIYDPPEPSDGQRILVDRLWPRGVSKQKAALTLWLKEIAPSTDLRKWYGHDPDREAEFRRRYKAELDNNPEAVSRLSELAKAGPVTLLYSVPDAVGNHAVFLAHYIGDQERPGNG
jgi:uncharacterized protein YeaO (DUF488 family)